jgi:RND family efflux transporter MFP subunit
MQTKPLWTRPAPLACALVLIAGGVVAAGIASRHLQAAQLAASASALSVPTVNLVSPSAVAGASLELPARIEAWARAPIYARVSGYLQRWNVDIGAPVKSGQLLAQIETPDLDQQLRQAQAELATARTNLGLSESTAQRWQSLRAAGAVSKQGIDEKMGDFAAKQSMVQALQANVERQLALKRYSSLVAPFDGVVTARNIDVGALVNVGGAAGSELFVVSDIRRLRVYVQVPQRQVALIRPGSSAQLAVPERAGRTYSATVQSMAQAINAGSGTMLVQLVVDNATKELLPGAFATVRFELPAGQAIAVPPGALIMGKNGVEVATVDRDSRVRIKRVTVERDLGNVVQLASGVDRADRIIDSPPDGISTGDLVRVAQAEQTTAR